MMIVFLKLFIRERLYLFHNIDNSNGSLDFHLNEKLCCGGMLTRVSALQIKWSRLKPWCWVWCYILRQDTSLSEHPGAQCMYVNGYW